VASSAGMTVKFTDFFGSSMGKPPSDSLPRRAAAARQ
jgi:hypothetical protein